MTNALDIRLSEISHDNTTPRTISDDILMHYGVKGMKWGVRKAYKKLGSSNAREAYVKEIDKKWADKIQANPKTGKIVARATKKSNRDIKQLTKEYKDQGYKFGPNTLNSKNIDNRRNRTAKREYESTVKDIIQSNLEVEANKVHKSSKSRLQKVDISQQSDGTYKVTVVPNSNYKIDKQLSKVAKYDERQARKAARLAKKEAKASLKQSSFVIHAEDVDEEIDFEGLSYILTVDSDGFFDELIAPGLPIEHTTISEAEEYLAHYGVKGMKWGVRRNLKKAASSVSKSVDGAKGKAAKKISEIKSDRTKIAAAKRKAKNKVALAKVAADEKVKLNQIESKAESKIGKAKSEASKPQPSDSSKAPKITSEKSLRDMSNQELQDRINRANLEKNYMRIVEESRPKSAGEVMANYAKAKAMKAGDKVVDKIIEKGTEEIASMAFSQVKNAATKKSKGDDPKDSGDSAPKSTKEKAPNFLEKRKAAKVAKAEAKENAEKKAAEEKKQRVEKMVAEYNVEYSKLRKKRADKAAAEKKAKDDYYNDVTERFIDSVRKERKKRY